MLKDQCFDSLAADTNECIQWVGPKRNGYGAFSRGRGNMIYAHRFVCEEAHGKPFHKAEAAHSCGDRGCINKRHLRWATRSENQLDRSAHGTSNDGERHGGSVLTEGMVRDIRRLARTMKQRDVGDMFGVSQGRVSLIVNRKQWKCVA